MRHITHKAIGFVTYTIVVNLIYSSKTVGQYLLMILMIPIVLLSSKAPDKIDDEFGLPHREMSHSLIIWLLLSVIMYALALILRWYFGSYFIPIIPFTLAFSLSYFMHILADAFTDNGVQLLWPFTSGKRKPIYRLWYYDQGERYERYVTITGLVIGFSFWISIFYHMVR